MRRSAAVLAAVVALAAGAWGQNLEELAKKEKARRKAIPATKTFTNDDITKPSPSPSPSTDPNTSTEGPDIPWLRARRPYRPPATPAPEGATSGGGTEGRASEGGRANENGSDSAPSSDDAGAQAYWQGRAKALRETIEKTQGTIASLEARAAELRLDRDPNPPDQFDPNRLQKREAERQKALEDASKARATLAEAQQAQQALTEEARGKGVPLSWVQ